MLHFYSVGDPAILKRTPIRTFWLMSKNVDRLRAEAEYQRLQSLTAVTSGEMLQKHSEQLLKIIGKVVHFDEDERLRRQIAGAQLDRIGLDSLRGKGKLA